MKLQDKINYRFFAVLLIVFIAMGFVLYVAMGLFVDDKFDEILENRSEKIIEQLAIDSTTIGTYSPDRSIEIQPSPAFFDDEVYVDTLVYDAEEHEDVLYRAMTFGVTSQGKPYRVTLFLSKLETEDLVEAIFYMMLGLFAIIVVMLFLLNRWLSASVWKPFYQTLGRLSGFKIGQTGNADFGATNVYEFKQLNQALAVMVDKAQADFNNLKAFTENASHEIQTPLAIIQTKLEAVLQDKTLDAQRYAQIQSAYEAVSRLAKLNEALLLLSKIENRQFPDVIAIDLCSLVKSRLAFIEEIIEFRQLEVAFNINEPFVARLNPYLAEILVNNLLGNAVKHNVEGGQITVRSTNRLLTISNTGNPLTVAPEKLFHRFAKHNAGNESCGLGLAIASEICSKSELTLRYHTQNNTHYLTICPNS